MAITGLHVTCVYTGGERDRDRISLPTKAVWSDAPASGVSSTEAAPDAKNKLGVPVFQVYSAVEAYIAIGRTPNPNASPRTLIPAATPVDILVEPGDKFAWIAS